MTEERFEKMMEHAGDVIENTVEGVANIVDHSLEAAAKHSAVRILFKVISYAGCLGMIIGANYLEKHGHHLFAKICFITGCAGIATNLILSILFRRK